MGRTRVLQRELNGIILYGLLCFHFSLLDDTVSYRLSIYLLVFYIFALTIFMRKFKGKKLFWFKQALMSFGAIITLIWLTLVNTNMYMCHIIMCYF